MRLRITPRTASFSDAFAGLARHVLAGAVAVRETMGMSPAARRPVLQRLEAIEQAGDKARHEIVELAANSFVTPFDRGDVHDLASAMDACLNHMERAVDAGVRHRVEEPPDGVPDLVDVLVRMAELTLDHVPALATPQGPGTYAVEINRLENRAETTRRQLMTALLADGADPLQALRVIAVVDELVGAIRAFEHLATLVEGIVVKES